jgi:hypothetical protein
VRSFRNSGSGRFRDHAGRLVRVAAILLAIAFVLAVISAYLHARH